MREIITWFNFLQSTSCPISSRYTYLVFRWVHTHKKFRLKPRLFQASPFLSGVTFPFFLFCSIRFHCPWLNNVRSMGTSSASPILWPQQPPNWRTYKCLCYANNTNKQKSSKSFIEQGECCNPVWRKGHISQYIWLTIKMEGWKETDFH